MFRISREPLWIQFFRRGGRLMLTRIVGFDPRVIPLLSAVIAIIGMVKYPEYRVELGYFLMAIFFLAFSFGLYLAWKEDRDKAEYVLAIHDDHKRNPENFIRSRLSKVAFNTSTREVRIDVEWFNGTVFRLDFQSANGNGIINGSGLKHASSQMKLSCDAGRTCIYPLHFSANEKSLEDVDKASIERKGITVEMTLDWVILVSGRERHLSLQGPKAQHCVVPERF